MATFTFTLAVIFFLLFEAEAGIPSSSSSASSIFVGSNCILFSLIFINTSKIFVDLGDVNAVFHKVGVVGKI